MSARRCVVVVLMAALVVTAAGCNLPSGKAGAKCSPVGKGAQDGTYILTCNKNHRYQRIMTLAQGDALLRAYLLAHVPTTTTTTPAPTPPTTTFGAGTYPVGSTAGHVPAGLYTANAGAATCGWQRLDGSNNELGYNSFTGVDFMQVLATDASIRVVGGCTWSPAPAGAVSVPANGDATYRVGAEIPQGWYSIAGGPDCYYEVDSALDGTAAAILTNGFSTGPYLLDATSSVAGIQIRGCGPLTARSAPTESVVLFGDPGDLILPSNSLWFDPTSTTITATSDAAKDEVTVTAGGYTIVMAAPTGTPLATGTYPVSPQILSVTQNGTTPALSFHSGSASCSNQGLASKFTINGITFDGSGNVTHLSASFLQYCNSSTPASAGLISI